MNMLCAGFCPPLLPGNSTFKRRSLPAQAAARGCRVCMRVSSPADAYMNRSQTREAKQAAALTGVYTPQCTEASGGCNTAEATRLASLARSFRLRQMPISRKMSDLFDTRRAAIIAAAGSHVDESYACRFPARAAATVAGRAEMKRACSRYVVADEPEQQYMFQCVDRQYEARQVAGGVYSVGASSARQAGDVDVARVAAAATAFRAGTFSIKQKMQLRYNASLEAVFSGRGCSYEEGEYLKFPKMAGAIRWSNGAYAADVVGVTGTMGVKMPSVTERIQGVNRDSFFPGYKMRPAVERKAKFWEARSNKYYGGMSSAAVEWGIRGVKSSFENSVADGWKSGWQPKPINAGY